MAEVKYRGVEQTQELHSNEIRPDTRPTLSRLGTAFRTTDGVVTAMLWMQAIGVITVFLPFSGEIVLLGIWGFYWLFVDPGHTDPKRTYAGTNQIKGKFRAYSFPFRVPKAAKRFDASYVTPKLGAGITFLGKERSTKLEIWSSDSDLRTHMLVLGTTGSGKTELLLGLVYNALVQNSGFIYTDGKGDVSLWNNVFRLARYLGREYDLLLINFLTSGRDFLDKQVDRTTNTMNPFALGSSGMLIELIVSLMDDSGGGGDMWKGRAIAFVAGLTRVLCFLRDRGYILLDSTTFIEFFELPVVERVVWDRKIVIDDKEVVIQDELFGEVLEPLKAFILTLPGYSKDKKGAQEQKTLEQHGFITMQLTRLFGDLSFTYGYIFKTSLGEVDMYDVVINRRILAVLLPALERAPDSLRMLGKLIVGSIKQMMAGCLGNRVEGSVREIVEARPTNASVPFYVVLDEYGYYAVLGFAVAPAQARSLGFPQPLDAMVRMADGREKRMGDIQVGEMVYSPDGRAARVSEVKEFASLPLARINVEAGLSVRAAYTHHWPVRIMHQQDRVLTTREIEHLVKTGIRVEVARMLDGVVTWAAVESVTYAGVEEARCFVVDHPMHCYVTDHGIVTHNCITFAAQDFSSLQKSSKEEADATWENTNVRAVGRITSGSESETWRRLRGVAGETVVYENGAKEHNESGMFEWSAKLDVKATRVSRLEFDDLSAQENGEFTFLIGKKSERGGGIRIIRGMSFYTGVDPKDAPTEIRLNHFLKVKPPMSAGGEEDSERIEALEKIVTQMMVDGSLAKIYPNNALEPLPANDIFRKLAVYVRAARKAHGVSLFEAWRAAFVSREREGQVLKEAGGGQVSAGVAPTASPVSSPEVPSGERVEDVAQTTEIPGASDDDFSLSVDIPIDLTADSAAVPAPQSASPVADVAVGVGGAELELDVMVDAVDLIETVVALDVVGVEEPAETDAKVFQSPVVEQQADAMATPKAMVTDFLDGYDFGRPAEPAPFEGGQSAGDNSGALVGKQQVSALTFRVLGSAALDAPTEEEDLIAEAIESAELALGASKDTLSVKAGARETVRELERRTAYADGAIPEPATLEDWDATIEDLESAAAANPPNYL
ncbi:hypothetical protein [Pandoraea sp. ISTKB]|uniref:hypothetical protein n=1 Tax=Pandoraea sp. ISTKB TaxID=1586708 RepID=UPI000846CED5|nr:hypothetical protein [Pandoraea sp. ISTKB]ODP35065.1 hypothetical protein A9762_11935 [Pandoraea sp. ISTKB]